MGKKQAKKPARDTGKLHRLAARDDHAERIGKPRARQHLADARGPYAHDRDRILYSRSFRRLAHKTQVYLTSEGDERVRTRLTHTLEVSHIARAIARDLQMNEDLTEAIALGHDVGHAPFGHAGERQLNAFLSGKMSLPRRIVSQYPQLHEKKSDRPSGNFKHNYQSVRLLSFLETYEKGIDGLDLHRQTLEGILKHCGVFRASSHSGDRCCYHYPNKCLFETLIGNEAFASTVEGQIVAIADEIAQVAHDLGDAILAGSLDPREFINDKQSGMSEIIRETANAANQRAKRLRDECVGAERRQIEIRRPVIAGQFVACIVSYFVDKSTEHGRRVLKRISKGSWPCEVWQGGEPAPRAEFEQMRKFKDQVVINNFNVNRLDNKGQYIIRRLIDAYVTDPRQLPDAALLRFGRAKAKEVERLEGESGVGRWFSHMGHTFGLKQIMPDEISVIVKVMKEAAIDGVAIRQVDWRLMDKLLPYFLLDLDYLRAVADHIAMMTDSFAEREMQRLYGHARPAYG